MIVNVSDEISIAKTLVLDRLVGFLSDDQYPFREFLLPAVLFCAVYDRDYEDEEFQLKLDDFIYNQLLDYIEPLVEFDIDPVHVVEEVFSDEYYLYDDDIPEVLRTDELDPECDEDDVISGQPDFIKRDLYTRRDLETYCWSLAEDLSDVLDEALLISESDYYDIAKGIRAKFWEYGEISVKLSDDVKISITSEAIVFKGK